MTAREKRLQTLLYNAITLLADETFEQYCDKEHWFYNIQDELGCTAEELKEYGIELTVDGCVNCNDGYYVVQQETHEIDRPYIRTAWEVNSFYNLDEAVDLVNKLCADIVNDYIAFEKSGERLERIRILYVVENSEALRVKEDTIYVYELV